MRWLNALAQRGLRPTPKLPTCKHRQQIRPATVTSSILREDRLKSRVKTRSNFGLRHMESLENRAMLAAHDGGLPNSDSVYTFELTPEFDSIVIEPGADNTALGQITASNTGNTNVTPISETFTRFTDLVIDISNINSDESEITIDVTGASSLEDTGLAYMTIRGHNGVDRIHLSEAAIRGVSLEIDSAGGVDELIGTMTSNSVDSSLWTITHSDGGFWNVGDDVSAVFRNVENLTGAAGHDDLFRFQDNGRLAGIVTGQDDDFDSIELTVSASNSPRVVFFEEGSVQVDQQIIYSHANISEPENLIIATTETDDHLLFESTSNFGTFKVASQNNTFEPVSYNLPTGSTTLKFGGGNDTFQIAEAALTELVGLVIDGGVGEDELIGPPAALVEEISNSWIINSENEGFFNDQVFFADIEKFNRHLGTPRYLYVY